MMAAFSSSRSNVFYFINKLKLINFNSLKPNINNIPNICNYANDVTVTIDGPQQKQQQQQSAGNQPIEQKEKISKAMRAYLERAKSHDEFMKIQNIEFQIGKRHLANMMGEDPEMFTQDDIDRSIEYLFPSGLYDKKARPVMKPPEEIFPKRKAAEFDKTGRPHHTMFYTGLPHFFKLMFDIVEQINDLNRYEDRMIKRNALPDETQKINLSGTQWLPKDDIQQYLVEEITDLEYTNFVNAMNRLATLPYSYKKREFIDKFRKMLLMQTATYEIPKPLYREDGRQYVTTYECLRKRARGDVTVISPGTGLITINGQDITYFEHKEPREQNANYPIKNSIQNSPSAKGKL